MTISQPEYDQQQQMVFDNTLQNDVKRIPLWGWVARLLTIMCLSYLVLNTLIIGFRFNDPLVIYSTLMPTHTLLIFIIAWFFFKAKVNNISGNELVSVIIPVYNQELLIENVLDAIFKSTYKEIEVIAINDGSTDGTGKILEELSREYPRLTVIQKKNGGKRTAVEAGFRVSNGNYIILIDSDSIIESHAIEELMKAFKANPRAGGLVGDGKILNAEKNILTKCQSAWYDYSFNIHKSCESHFGTVLCCSGCLAAYRKSSIRDYMPYWAESKVQYSDDRALTTFAIAEPWVKKELAPIPQKLMESMANYDDSEDRGLTAQTLLTWETHYVPTAIVFTEAPETIKKYFRQQLRWKKGYIRSNFFVSAFFWRKNPLISLIFYLEFMTTFTSPLIILTIYLYAPIILHDLMLPITFLIGQLLVGLAAGLDYKAREQNTKYWMYNPVMNIILTLILSWLIIPALITFKQKKWLTR